MPRRAPLIGKSNDPRSRRGDLRDGFDTPSEILIEYVSIGSSVKVMAVDPVSGVEVAITGPISASRSDLERLACRKLMAKLNKPVSASTGSVKRGKTI